MKKKLKFTDSILPVLFILALLMAVINAESKEQKGPKEQYKTVTITGLVFIEDENEFGEATAVGIMVESKTKVERYYVENSAKGIELLEETLNTVSVTGTVYKNKNGEMWIKVASWKLIEYEDTEGKDTEGESSNEE